MQVTQADKKYFLKKIVDICERYPNNKRRGQRVVGASCCLLGRFNTEYPENCCIKGAALLELGYSKEEIPKIDSFAAILAYTEGWDEIHFMNDRGETWGKIGEYVMEKLLPYV